eukprot:4524353-Amphidinium_carterae.1
MQDGRLKLALTVVRQLQDVDCLTLSLQEHLEKRCAGPSSVSKGSLEAKAASAPLRGYSPKKALGFVWKQ